jgi:branched-chain amino acid transport system permease protein
VRDADIMRVVLLAVPAMLLIGLLLPARRWRPVVAVVAGAGAAYFLVAGLSAGQLAYVVTFLVMGAIYAILSLGLNVQWGYNGHLNFGIAGLYAVGAFTFALFTTEMPTGLAAQYSHQAFGLGMPFLVGVLAAAVVAGIVALLVAIPVLRLRLDFLAIATIGIAEIIRLIFQNERWLANGPQPLRGIPRPLACLFESPPCDWLPAWAVAPFAPLTPRDYPSFYLLIVALFLAGLYVLVERACRSPWGRMLRAVRDEEASAAMSGKNVTAVRIQTFVVGGVIMGIAGALYAPFVVTIDYGHFHAVFATFLVWVMLMLGGSGNNRGAVIGGFIVWGVWSGTAILATQLGPLLAAISPDLPARAAYIRWMLVALLLVVIVLYRPQGLFKEEKQVSKFLAPGGKAPAPPGEEAPTAR